MECPYCSADLGAGVAQVGKCSQAQQRSRDQHARFFSMIAIAYEQWPEGFREFQPTSPMHLRKWLTAKAGYVHRIDIQPPDDLVGDDPNEHRSAMRWMMEVAKGIRETAEYSWLVRHKRGIQIIIPRSVSFEKMSQRDFNNLSARTDTELEIVGFDVRTLFDEADKRAGGHGKRKAQGVHPKDEGSGAGKEPGEM